MCHVRLPLLLFTGSFFVRREKEVTEGRSIKCQNKFPEKTSGMVASDCHSPIRVPFRHRSDFIYFDEKHFYCESSGVCCADETNKVWLFIGSFHSIWHHSIAYFSPVGKLLETSLALFCFITFSVLKHFNDRTQRVFIFFFFFLSTHR